MIIPEEGFEIDPVVLRARLRAEISSYKTPRVIVTMAYNDVPRTDAAGKPRKDALRARLEADELKGRDKA